MAKITTVKAGPSKGKVNPIQKRTPVGVKEDGYKKQLEQRSKKITHETFSAETSNASGQVIGMKVQ